MATFNTTITFSHPEDVNSDRLDLYESTTKSGTYTLVTSADYEYGITSYYATDLNDSKYY